jgi:hypothetical protein
MDLSIVSQFMSLTPDMMYKATKMVETVQSYFPGDVDAQEQYLNENLIDQTLEYALTLLEDKKVRDYMDVAVYTNGKTFSAPTLALYNVASMPEMKQRIQAKLNARGGMKKEELELQERKMSKAAHKRAARAGKRWQDSDCDGEWYEPGDDVRKTRTRKARTRKARNEAVDYVAELWRNRNSDDQLDEVKGYGGHIDPQTGKPTGRRSPSQQAHATHWRNRQQGKDVSDPRRSKFYSGGSTGSTTGYHQGEPPEHFATGQDPDLATTPANRMRARATSLAAKGKTKQANKIRSVMNRPPMGEEYVNEGQKEFPYGKVGDKLRSIASKKQKAKTPEEKNKLDSRAKKIGKEYWYPEEFTTEAKNKEGKEQGADGKACWNGYKYAGTKNGKDKCVKMEDVAEIATEYFLSEGLNEYGIDILIEEMGLDDFCDFVDEISTEEVLLEWRRGAGGTKVRGSGMSKSGKPIGSLKGGAKSSAIRASAEHKARKAEREREPSKTSGMKAALQSQSKIAMAKRSQPETKSTPTQTKEKSKGGILGALKARAERDTKLLKKSINTAGNVAARRAAEVAGVTVGVSRYIGKKMKQEEKELLTHYFLESEIAFNYDEVQEIFESLDQEHFDYFLEQAMLMVEESGPSAREIIEETLYNTFDIERFAFADWRQLTEKNSGDEATGKFVSLTQTNRTDNTPDVRGRRKDGVIINPQVDMRCEDEDLKNYQKSTQSSIDNVKKTKGMMVNRASASIAANRVKRDVETASKYGPQRQKPGTVGAYRREH